MSPEQRLEWEKLKETVKRLERVEDTSFIESIYRRLEARIDEKLAAIKLNDLNDVDTSGVTNGQVIKYTSSTETWENANDIDT